MSALDGLVVWLLNKFSGKDEEERRLKEQRIRAEEGIAHGLHELAQSHEGCGCGAGESNEADGETVAG
jgi:hypothetical protein